MKKYLTHLPTCNKMQDWSEADQALSDTPMQFRDYKYYEFEQELQRKRHTCTCGVEDANNKQGDAPQIDVIEGNKLIDNFVNPPKENTWVPKGWQVLIPNYHSDWDLIMQVYQKIMLDLPYRRLGSLNVVRDKWGHGIECTVYGQGWIVFYFAPTQELYDEIEANKALEAKYNEVIDMPRKIGGTMKQSYFAAIVQFIEWYNQQNPQQ